MNKLKLFLVGVLIVLLCGNDLHAQQQPQFTMYMFNPLVANPAVAGSRDALSVTMLGRKQWVGVDGAPNTATLSIHSPFRNESFAFGFSAMFDEIGPSQTTSIFGDFTWRSDFVKNTTLAIGAKFGADVFGVRYNTLDATHEQDPLWASNIPNKGYFNGGIGVYWFADDFYVGASIPKLVQNDFSSVSSLQLNGTPTKSAAKQVYHYMFNAGYSFELSSTFDIIPSMMVKAVPNAPLAVDVNVNLLMYDKLWVGGGYRFGSAAVANLMWHFSPLLRAGYAFDYTVGPFSQFNSGSHEIMVNYDLDFLGKGFPDPRRF